MTIEWRAPSVEREEPPLIEPEREALESWLDYHRLTLLHKCAGLSDAQLKERSVPPSSLSLLGLVRHMTEVERWWFRRVAGREEVSGPYSTDELRDADFDDLEDADAATCLQAYDEEVEAARRVADGLLLDDTFESPGHHPERVRNLRWIYLHMIEEYARHNGHADLIRERIDGTTGD
ncbi:MAG TPA: DinB family protein [Acidimicrobiales bacterium]|nr:DinB family protein [Acidimicrobiales bacterium]